MSTFDISFSRVHVRCIRVWRTTGSIRRREPGSSTSWASSKTSVLPGSFSLRGTSSNSLALKISIARFACSGADSAVCRCIGLTRVDPIRLHLPFERFLSAERGRPPDIDIDFEAERREEVIQYCYRRYGRERAAMVSNVITYRARSVLQDVGKAFGLTQAQVNALTKYLDTRSPQHLSSEIELPAGLTSELIYDMCRDSTGSPATSGSTPEGMVVAQRPLWEVVPLEWGRMEDRSVLQWDKDDCAAMGIVKFDLAGPRSFERAPHVGGCHPRSARY